MNRTPPCAGCERPTRHVQAMSATQTTLDCYACQYCSGVLVPTAALEAIVGAPLSFAPSAAHEARSCPRCRITMSTEQTRDVTVDRCAACQEVFLDAGELEKIAGRQLFLRKPPALQAQTDAAEAAFRKAREETVESLRRDRENARAARSSIFDFSSPYRRGF